MGRAIVIAGTDTGVGKTWLTAQLALAFRDIGQSVGVHKVCEAHDPAESPDSLTLSQLTGDQQLGICPARWSYSLALAPPIAARQLGRKPPVLTELVTHLGEHRRLVDWQLIESAGGVRSPIAVDADTVDLVNTLCPEHVVLVAKSILGVLSLVRMSCDALMWPATTVYLNWYDERVLAHRSSREWLENEGFACVTDIAGLVAHLT